MTYEEIQVELRSLSEKLSGNAEMTSEELTQIEERVNELESEKKALEEKAEKRDATLEKVRKGLNGTEVESAEERKEDNKMEVNYRTAFLKNLMRKALTAEEERALTTSTTAALPTETSDKIFDKMVQLVPLLGEIELFHVPGNLKFAVETTRADAGYHTENSTGINVDASAVLTTVTLGGYEFTKLIQVSDSILQMSIDDFEDWLVRMLAESIATKIEYEIINGTGSSTVKGINAISYDSTNGVQYNGSTGLTGANVRTAVGLLPGGYDRGAKFLMKKATLFNQFMGLQDNAKHDLVRVEGNNYYIYGYPVILSDEVATGVAFLGNFKKYVGNLNRDIEVKKDFDIDTNSYKYLGVGIFDGKPACEDAFIKIATSL